MSWLILIKAPSIIHYVIIYSNKSTPYKFFFEWLKDRVGRPFSQVDMDTVRYLKALGMTVKDIARVLCVSRQTIYNRINSSANVTEFATYSAVSDSDLDTLVSRVKAQHPNNGEVMIAGYLASEGVRVPRRRLRASIHRVDPIGVEERRHHAIRR